MDNLQCVKQCCQIKPLKLLYFIHLNMHNHLNSLHLCMVEVATRAITFYNTDWTLLQTERDQQP